MINYSVTAIFILKKSDTIMKDKVKLKLCVVWSSLLSDFD